LSFFGMFICDDIYIYMFTYKSIEKVERLVRHLD